MAIAEPSTGDAPEIEDGMYDLTCTDVSDPFEEMDFNGKKKIKKVRIFIQVHGTDDGEGEEITLDPKVNLKWSPGGDYPPSTLFLYASAFCGPQDGDVPFDTDNLKGKSCQGMIKTETGKWPRIEPKSLLPAKKNGAKHVADKGFETQLDPDDDVPYETEASPLNDWLTAMRGVGFSTKEIIDLCKSRFEKLPRELSDLQRDLLGKEYGI